MTHSGSDPRLSRGRRLPAAEVGAHERARTILAAAEEQAARRLEEAEREAASVLLKAETEARANGVAAVAARAVTLAAREDASLDQQREHVVDLARLLAERLLGEQLRLAPETVVALATQVLEEARGTRRVRIVAHPEDVPLLVACVDQLEGAGRAVEVVGASNRKRGELRLESDIGTLDAELAPQLDRLAARLREALKE